MSTQKPHLTLELRTMIEDGLNQKVLLPGRGMQLSPQGEMQYLQSV